MLQQVTLKGLRIPHSGIRIPYLPQSQQKHGGQSSDQPRPQGLLLDDVQNGGSSGEDPGKG